MDELNINNYGAGNAQLPATEDDYQGIMVEMKEHMDSDVFQELLKTSMLQCKLQGKKGVWIKLPTDLANLQNIVQTAIKEGFWYDHAEPNYLMLGQLLRETTNTLPENVSRRADVGAFVFNDEQYSSKLQDDFGSRMRISAAVQERHGYVIPNGPGYSMNVLRRPIYAAENEPGSAENEERNQRMDVETWQQIMDEFTELKEMRNLKLTIDRKAKKNARRVLWAGLAILLLMSAVFLVLMWTLPWDVMEVVWVSLSLTVFVCGYAFYTKTLREPSYKSGFEALVDFFKSRAMTEEGFDKGKYRRLRKSHGHRLREDPLDSLV